MTRWILSVALFASFAGCGGGPTPSDQSTPAGVVLAPPSDEGGVVLAKVNGMPVGSDRFQLAAARVVPADGKALSSEEKHEVLDQVVSEEVLFQEAFKRGLYRDAKVRKILMNLLLREEVYGNVRNTDFSESEIRAYYDAHKEEFVVPEKVQVMRILIKAGPKRSEQEARALAEKLRGELAAILAKFPVRAPENRPGRQRGGVDRAVIDAFKDLAMKHSQDPYKRRGGDLGFLARQGKPGIDPVVVSKAFGMKVGQVSEVFDAGGFNILLVANRRARVERTYEQMKGSVLRKLKTDRHQELQVSYLAKLKAEYQIDVDEAALTAQDVDASRRIGPGMRGKAGGPMIERMGANARGGKAGKTKGGKAKGGKAGKAKGGKAGKAKGGKAGKKP